MRLFHDRLELPGALLWVAAWTIVALQYTTLAGAMAAAGGALLGLIAAQRMPRRDLRLALVLPSCFVAWILLFLLCAALRHWPLLYSLLGRLPAAQAAEMLLWGGTASLASMGLELLRSRMPEAAALRVAFAIAAFASLLAAHRDGAQQRPYSVVDPLVVRGHDPVDFFLLVGVAAAMAALLFCLFNARFSGGRLRSSLLLVGLIALLLLLAPASLPRWVMRAQQAAAGHGAQGSGGGAPRKSNSNGSGQGGSQTAGKGPGQGNGNGKGQGKTGGGGSASGKGNSGHSGGSSRPSSGPSSGSSAPPNGGQNQDPDLSMNNPPEKNEPQPVAVVTFHEDYDPPSGYYYFRQSILTRLENDQLTAGTDPQYEQGVSDGFPLQRTPVAGQVPRQGYAQEIHTNIALLAPHSRPFGLLTPVAYMPAANPDPKRFERAYRADSMALAASYTALLLLPSANPLPSDPQALGYFTAAPADPRFAAIVKEAIAKLPPAAQSLPLARAWAVKTWLDARVTYNAQATHNQAADPVADFLFGDRNGYCVHFAQAAALLYRTAGIPARVSEGYAVPSRQRGHGSSLLIRSGDAHAWPEIYLEGAGWIPVDISPQHVATPPEQPVDPEQQRMLGEMSRQNPQPTPASGAKSAGQPWLWKILMALPSLLCAWLLRLYLCKIWRRIAIYFCPSADLPRVSLLAALACLADGGLLRSWGATREQFACTLRPAIPALETLTRLHAQSFLGSMAPGAPGNSRKHYLRLCRDVSAQVRCAIPKWRRILGWLDPTTAWRVY